MKKVTTFGEVMIRLATPRHLRFSQTSSLEFTFGGGEANVAVSLSQFGLPTTFVTRLPENDMATTCIQQLRGLGVDTNSILRGGERMGIYFLETGASQRASAVTYDRSNSSIAGIDPSEPDWDAIFKDSAWFHFTGITPALSDTAAEATLRAAAKAKSLGLVVSCDLNFRKKLWSTTKAREVMTKLMSHVDVCIANEEDAEKVFGIQATDTSVTGGQIAHERYLEVAEKLTSRFQFKSVAITLRESHSASHNGWSGLLYTEGQGYFSRHYDMKIVDRVGGGDSFAAGLIYALVHERDPQSSIEFAVAASCLKHSISGDYNRVSLAEVEALVAGDGSGRVQR
jgi:2-dehydro-3-deoxygluconokinase